MQTEPDKSVDKSTSNLPQQPQQQQSKMMESETVAGRVLYNTQTRVKQGINTILPKDIINGLMQEQGRRKVEKWVKSPHGNYASQKFEADVSPTRDYMLRKFNSTRR